MTSREASELLRRFLRFLARTYVYFKRELYDSVKADKLNRHQTRRYYRVYPEELGNEIRQLKAEFWLVLPWIVGLAVAMFTGVMLIVSVGFLSRAFVL